MFTRRGLHPSLWTLNAADGVNPNRGLHLVVSADRVNHFRNSLPPTEDSDVPTGDSSAPHNRKDSAGCGAVCKGPAAGRSPAPASESASADESLSAARSGDLPREGTRTGLPGLTKPDPPCHPGCGSGDHAGLTPGPEDGFPHPVVTDRCPELLGEKFLGRPSLQPR